MIFWTGVLIIVGLLAYIRLAPSDPDRWHQPVTADQDKNMKTGAIRVIDAGPGALAQVDAAARELDRTEVLAGSVADGRVTYVTRSRLMGFPDYTTVEQDGNTLKMYARLRFGKSDLGVNAARLRQLAAAVQ